MERREGKEGKGVLGVCAPVDLQLFDAYDAVFI